MRVLCVFGEYQYGNLERELGTEYGAFIPALKNLGHEVYHFESWGCRQDLKKLNLALVDTVKRIRPDVVLLVPMEYEIWIETLQHLATVTDTALVCWGTDDSWKYREVSRFLGHCFHGMITTYPHVVEKYHADGFNDVLVSQWAASVLSPPLPAADCQYQVTFVGAAHGNRYKLVEELRARGIDVQCFGYGWEAGPVGGSRVTEIMRRSVISLNFSNSKGESQIKARIFEITGAGGFLLTDYVPGIEHFFEIGREIETFSSTDELADKVRFFLENPKQRDLIASAGFLRTSREHTYTERMRSVLRFAQLAKSQHLLPFLNECDYYACLSQYRLGLVLRILRRILIAIFVPLFGRKRGVRAARRLVFELSWRFAGARTFTAAGLPGRMFPGV